MLRESTVIGSLEDFGDACYLSFHASPITPQIISSPNCIEVTQSIQVSEQIYLFVCSILVIGLKAVKDSEYGVKMENAHSVLP